MRHRFAVAALALAALVAFAGCKSSTTPVVNGLHTVTIQNSAFNPASLTIAAGERVQWKNLDATVHTATSDNGNAINTGSLSLDGTSNAVTFTGTGSFAYHCQFHGTMHGTITVQ